MEAKADKHKKYRETHKEQIAERKKTYRENHKEQINEYKRNYYEQNKERISEYKKEYYQRNRIQCPHCLNKYDKKYVELHIEKHCRSNPKPKLESQIPLEIKPHMYVDIDKELRGEYEKKILK